MGLLAAKAQPSGRPGRGGRPVQGCQPRPGPPWPAPPRAALQELWNEMKDPSKLGQRGEGWFLAQVGCTTYSLLHWAACPWREHAVGSARPCRRAARLRNPGRTLVQLAARVMGNPVRACLRRRATLGLPAATAPRARCYCCPQSLIILLVVFPPTGLKPLVDTAGWLIVLAGFGMM